MARTFYPSYRSRANNLFYEPVYFQRKKDNTRTRKKRINKKISLKYGHILLFLLLMIGMFYLFQKLYIFLISWDYLNIKEIRVICPRQEIRKEIEDRLKEQNLGNILLADIGQLQQTIKGHLWVREAQVRKVFPASLRIEIEPREPVAILKRENLYLIDQRGQLLEKVDSAENLSFPLLIDSNNFQKSYQEKLCLAWECLKSLSPSERENIRSLDLSYYGWATLHLKDDDTRLILGYKNFAQSLYYFHQQSPNLEAYFGPLEYVDLRFQDRLYIKPKKNRKESVIPNLKKEGL